MVLKIFYFHPEPWGRFPFWRAYFSKGLKPPTSIFVEASTCRYQVYLKLLQSGLCQFMTLRNPPKKPTNSWGCWLVYLPANIYTPLNKWKRIMSRRKWRNAGSPSWKSNLDWMGFYFFLKTHSFRKGFFQSTNPGECCFYGRLDFQEIGSLRFSPIVFSSNLPVIFSITCVK